MLKLKLWYFGHLMHQERPWCWERMKAGGEGDDRERDGWMASPTQWTWVWASSGRWWRTGKLGVLQSMGPQRVRHNRAIEQYTWKVIRDLSVPKRKQIVILRYDTGVSYHCGGDPFTMYDCSKLTYCLLSAYTMLCQLCPQSWKKNKNFYNSIVKSPI